MISVFFRLTVVPSIISEKNIFAFTRRVEIFCYAIRIYGVNLKATNYVLIELLL